MWWKLSNFAAGLSLVLFVVSGTLWALSHWWVAGAEYTARQDNRWAKRGVYLLISGDGAILMDWESFPTEEDGVRTFTYPYDVRQGNLQREFEAAGGHLWLGFGLLRKTKHTPIVNVFHLVSDFYWRLIFPWWSLAILSGLLPAVRFYAYRRSRRNRAAGLCPRCCYDLRATPEQCPECGGVVQATLRRGND